MFDNNRYLGQSVTAWVSSIGLVVVFALLLYAAKRFAQKRLRHAESTHHPGDTWARLYHVLATLISEIQPMTILLISAYFASWALEIPPRLEVLFDRTIFLLFALQAGFWGSRLIAVWMDHLAENKTGGPSERAALLNVLGFTSKLVMWSVLVMLMMRNVGIDVSALIAGFSFGAVAIGLAVRNILEDIFASLAIALDKPFLIGDAIQVDSEVGVVEAIGIKTTRLRALGGNQLIYSNAVLLQKPLHNYKRLRERRVVLRFGLSLLTSADELKRAPELVRAIVLKQNPVRFDRAHFVSIGEYDFRFEVVYFVESPDNLLHMNIQQAILTEMVDVFRKTGISFALPTRVNVSDWQPQMTRDFSEEVARPL